MLYIEKKSPPREMVRKVSEIKSSPGWKAIKDGNTSAIRSEFDSLPKDTIRESLLKEQHYLCAYCMRKIQNSGQSTSIEHWFPLSKNKDQALDYRNMLAVCDGGENWKGSGKKILCCDACKADEVKLNISPLNKQQMDKIAYGKDGFIHTNPYDKKMEEDLRGILRLNGLWKKGEFVADTSTELIKGRKDTYQLYENFVKRLGEEGKCTSSSIKKIIDKIQNAEHRPEYAGVLLYFFNKKYQSLVKRGL